MRWDLTETKMQQVKAGLKPSFIHWQVAEMQILLVTCTLINLYPADSVPLLKELILLD